MMRSLLSFVVALCVSASAQAEWNLRWSRELPKRKPAWEHTQRMPKDVGYHPELVGDLVVVTCEHNGAVLAYDAKTGKERWRFYTNGPLRNPATAGRDSVLVGSDDGWLYCLDTTGKLRWKHRGGPSARKVIGHERLISAWPVSTRPVVEGDTVYTVAGYWPVDGIFVQALDLASGKPKWANDTIETRPYGEPKFVDGKLVLLGFPKKYVLDRSSGKLLKEKAPKLPPRERPDVKGAKGATGWAESEDYLAVGSATGVTLYTKEKLGVLAESKTQLFRGPKDVEPAKRLLQKANVREGYAIVAGLRDGVLLEGLLDKSELHVIAVDDDPATIAKIRARLEQTRWFLDHRVDVVLADPAKAGLPPYVASLIVSETGAVPKELHRSLRPYGGVLVEGVGDELRVTRREGALKGSSDWPQEFADAANTLGSKDTLVKAPLGSLWYGGPAAHGKYYYDGFVDHQSGHGLNPQPVPAQILQGRMFLQSQGLLAAVDVYTGRILWESTLPRAYSFGGAGGGLGVHSKKHPKPWAHAKALEFEVPPTHHCRASGFDMVSSAGGVYVGAGRHLHRFDPTTGKLLAKWAVPLDKPKEELCWGGIRTSGGVLVCTAFRPADLVDARAGHDGNGGDWAGDRMPMAYILGVDADSGKLLWSRKAAWGFLNRSGFAIGDGKVFAVDLLTKNNLLQYKRAAQELPAVPPRLLALDLLTGKEVWTKPLDVYVQNLVFSAEKNLLLTPCRNLVEWKDGGWLDHSFDAMRGRRNKKTPGKMRALRAKDGSVEWEVAAAPYHSPHILLGELIIDRWGFSYDLNTGKRHQRTSAKTGKPEEWNFKKSGCNHLIACPNLVTWRCAFYDLNAHDGVTKLVGMDAGCSPTLLPANGVLCVPNFGTHHKRNWMTALALVSVGRNEP